MIKLLVTGSGKDSLLVYKMIKLAKVKTGTLSKPGPSLPDQACNDEEVSSWEPKLSHLASSLPVSTSKVRMKAQGCLNAS